MYSYQLFNKKKINYSLLLLDIKKLLPKSLNSIPDNAALSILEIIKKTNKKNYMLETGVGASTIAFFLGSFLRKKKFFSSKLKNILVLKFLLFILNFSHVKLTF